MNWGDLPEVFRDKADSYSEDIDKLESLLRLVGNETDLGSVGGPLFNFRTTTIPARYVHWNTEDGEVFPIVYAVGFIFDGDGGARVYITSKHSKLTTISYGRWLFEDVRAGDLSALGFLFEEMSEILDGATYEEDAA